MIVRLDAMPRILALDLSLTRTGYASSDGYGVIAPPKGLSGVDRLDSILLQVLELAKDAAMVCLEGYSFGSVTSQVRASAELGGLIRWALWRKEIPFAEVPPANLKLYATGRGNAGKEQVLAAAIRRLGYEGHDNNEADACWLLAIALDAYGLKLGPVPQSHRKALEKLKWPPLRPPRPANQRQPLRWETLRG